MTFSEAGFLAAGMIVGLFIATLFASVQFWNAYEEIKALKSNTSNTRAMKDYIKHLEQQVNPREWVDNDPAAAVRIKERLYDTYEALVEPGKEVVRITEEGDMPDLPDGWRKKAGDG